MAHVGAHRADCFVRRSNDNASKESSWRCYDLIALRDMGTTESWRNSSASRNSWRCLLLQCKWSRSRSSCRCRRLGPVALECCARRAAAASRKSTRWSAMSAEAVRAQTAVLSGLTRWALQVISCVASASEGALRRTRLKSGARRDCNRDLTTGWCRWASMWFRTW